VPTETTEAVLIEHARRGEEHALEAIYRRHSGRLFTLAFYSLGSRSAAEDAVQTIFARAFASIDRFEGASSLSTWLTRIAMNHVTDELRRRRVAYVPLESILGGDEEVSGEASPEERHAAQQTEVIVARALQELPPKLRTAVVLRYIDNLSYQEIAAVLGVSVGTVSSRLNRALAQLEPILRPLRA
jgi:RNA polymerase sigma-70 factor (ECF subfamily)